MNGNTNRIKERVRTLNNEISVTSLELNLVDGFSISIVASCDLSNRKDRLMGERDDLLDILERLDNQVYQAFRMSEFGY